MTIQQIATQRVANKPPAKNKRSMTKRFKFGLLTLALAALPLIAPTAHAETKDVKIPKAAVVTALNAYLAGFELQLDNWGSFRSTGGGTWHTNNSYMLFPSGAKKPFHVPRSDTVQLAGKASSRRYNAYIDNMTSQTINVKADGSRLKLNMYFESAGNEIRVGCINRRTDKPCKARLMKHKGNINNAYVSAWFKPTFSGSSMTLSPLDLTMDFDLKLDSWILDNLKNVASHFIDIKGKVRSAAKQAFLQEFNRPHVKSALTKDVNQLLFGKVVNLVKSRLGSAAGNYVRNNMRITRIKDAGSNYVVTVRYPDIVHGGSVKIVSFAPKSKKLTAGCPFNFGFNAAIQTDVKVSGKAWLELKPGRRGKARNWQMPKAGKASSTISTRIIGKPGRKTTKQARLAVNWKGTIGKTYTKHSKWVSFTGICSRAGGSLTLNK